MKGHIVDTTSPGNFITTGLAECESLNTPNAYSLATVREQIDVQKYGASASLQGKKKAIPGTPNWYGQVVIAGQAAFDYGMIAPLRLAKPGEDPVVIIEDPVAYTKLETLSPKVSHFLYRDGSIVSAVNFSLEENAAPNSHILSCIVRNKDDTALFDGNPNVLQWCRKQIARALPEADRRVSAFRFKNPPNRPY